MKLGDWSLITTWHVSYFQRTFAIFFPLFISVLKLSLMVSKLMIYFSENFTKNDKINMVIYRFSEFFSYA